MPISNDLQDEAIQFTFSKAELASTFVPLIKKLWAASHSLDMQVVTKVSEESLLSLSRPWATVSDHSLLLLSRARAVHGRYHFTQCRGCSIRFLTGSVVL